MMTLYEGTPQAIVRLSADEYQAITELNAVLKDQNNALRRGLDAARRREAELVQDLHDAAEAMDHLRARVMEALRG